MTDGQTEPALETLAAVTAAVEEGGDLETACATHALSVARYTSAKDRLLADLAAHAERGDLRSSRAWTRALAAAQRTARAAARKEKRKPPPGPVPSAPGPVVVPVIAPLVASAVAAPPPAATPPPLQGRSPEPSSAPWSEQPRTAPQPPVVPAPATPFTAQPAPPPFGPPLAPAVVPPPFVAPPAVAPPAVAPPALASPAVAATPAGGRKLGATMMHAGPLLPPTALPFQKAAPAARPPSEPPDRSRPAAHTMVADVSHVLAALGTALPFAGSEGAPPAPRPAGLPAVRRAPAALSGTQPPFGGAQPPPGGTSAALPFQRSETPARAAPARAAGDAPSAPTSGTLDAATRARAESFTLAQYARLCAELRADPDSAPRVRSSYGVDGPAWAHMHTVWQTRFKEDPGLRFRWEKQVEQILTKLRGG